MAKKKVSFTFVSKDAPQTYLHRFFVGFLVVFVLLLIFSTLTAAISSEPEIALTALKDVFSGIVFGATLKRDGLTLFAVIFSSIMFYLALILCITGIVIMIKKQHKERIIGIVTAYCGIVTSLYFVSVFAEYAFGNGKGAVNLFLPILLLIFTIGLYVLIGFDIYYSVNLKAEIELYDKNILNENDIFKQNREAHPEEEDTLIKMRDVRVAFKIGSIERVIINHLNLDIKRGEILGLVGESGSGKTTIGRALIRINPVSGGEITYNGVRISGKINKKTERLLKTKVQMIFQDPGDSLNDRANIDYIVSEGLRAFHLYKDEKDRLEKVSHMMERVGLRPEYLTRYPHEFSGGQRQRIGIARCMIMNPELVIADEPISAIDVSIRAQVLNLIKEFQQERKMTVVFIAHDLSVVRYISDRIAVIYAGHLVEIAPANRLFEAPLHPYTKSLLSAVPIPDPKVEKNKKIIVYNPAAIHHYKKSDAPRLVEIEPNHFVRCDTPELEAYKLELERLGGKK